MRIAIAGTGKLGMSLMQPLLHSGHEVVAVVQDGRRTKGYRRWLVPRVARVIAPSQSPLGRARAQGVPIVWIDRITEEELAPLRALRPDILLVGGFSIILKRPLLDLPALGCVNTHSSLLPRHRGPNPFCAAIMSGDEEAGVTFHVMDEGIDTGDILDQTAFPLEDRVTSLKLYGAACAVARDRVVAVMDRIEREGLHGAPQDSALATYDKKPTMESAWIQWDEPAERIDRRVRAMAPAIMPRFRFEGRTVFVGATEYRSEAVDSAPGTVLRAKAPARIATGRGTLVLRAAFTKGPIPFFWPPPWTKLTAGTLLENR